MIVKLALDTNAYRALDDGVSILSTIVKAATYLAVPITVLGELYHGIFLGSKTDINLQNLDHFLSIPRVEILQIDELTAKLFGEIATELQRKGKPIQQDDIWIAALCKQYNYTLATSNKGFREVTGLQLFNFQ